MKIFTKRLIVLRLSVGFYSLNKSVEYRKNREFFSKVRGLHSYFERNGGSLVKAVSNSNRSMQEQMKTGREYSFSELGRLIARLEEL